MYQLCQQQAQAHATDPAAVNTLFEQCRAPVEQKKAIWMLGGVGLILLVTVAVYLVAPEYKRRRQRLVALTADEFPDVFATLERLCQTARLSSSPRFLWDPLNGAAVGLAFGRRGSYYVALTGGLVARFYADRPAFESVVLHELAHVRSGDVDKTYIAISMWQVFIMLGLVPLALTVVLAPDLWTATGLVWRAAALAVFVYLLRNAVLRSRETYADLQAAAWQAPNSAMTRVLSALPDVQRTGIARWRDLLRVHPRAGARLRALADTRPLFRIGFWDAFGAGLAAGIAYPSVVTLILLAFTGKQTDIWSWTTGEVAGLATSSLLALLVAGVVGVGLWRSTVAAIVDGRSSVSPAAIAGGVAVGLGLGAWVGFDGGFQLLTTDLLSVLVYAILYLLLIAMMAAGVFVILRWFMAASTLSLRRELGEAAPPRWWPNFLALSIVLAIWLGVTLQARDLLGVAASGLPVWLYPVLAGAAFLQAAWSPLDVLALACVIAFPLIVAGGRKRRPGRPDWAFLDPPSDGLLDPAPQPVAFRRLLVAALVGAIAYLVIVVVTRLAIGPVRDDVLAVILFVGEVAAAVIIQGVLAVIVSRKAAVVRITQGLAAASLGGVLMATIAFWVNVAFGGKADGAGAWSLLTVTLIVGAAVALPLAWLTARLTKA